MKIVLPSVYSAKTVAPPPHRAPTLARYIDDHGVVYEVKTNRTRTAWWLLTSKEGYKMSAPLRTSSKALATEWLAAMANHDFVVPSRVGG